MPLSTRIERNGEYLQLRWGDFHVAAMALASIFDTMDEERPEGELRFRPDEVYDTTELRFECYPDAPFPITRRIAFEMCSYPVLGRTPLNYGEYTLQRKHKFIDLADGEVLELLPGDKLAAVRGW
jgi:hypothetical protein